MKYIGLGLIQSKKLSFSGRFNVAAIGAFVCKILMSVMTASVVGVDDRTKSMVSLKYQKPVARIVYTHTGHSSYCQNNRSVPITGH